MDCEHQDYEYIESENDLYYFYCCKCHKLKSVNKEINRPKGGCEHFFKYTEKKNNRYFFFCKKCLGIEWEDKE